VKANEFFRERVRQLRDFFHATYGPNWRRQLNSVLAGRGAKVPASFLLAGYQISGNYYNVAALTAVEDLAADLGFRDPIRLCVSVASVTGNPMR
jgi:hypothetical protein